MTVIETVKETLGLGEKPCMSLIHLHLRLTSLHLLLTSNTTQWPPGSKCPKLDFRCNIETAAHIYSSLSIGVDMKNTTCRGNAWYVLFPERGSMGVSESQAEMWSDRMNDTPMRNASMKSLRSGLPRWMKYERLKGEREAIERSSMAFWAGIMSSRLHAREKEL